ncbi:unnamed protein product, partial [Rotaria sordida]
HSSNGFKHALTEILQDPLVLNRLSDTKAAEEMKLLDQFMHRVKPHVLRTGKKPSVNRSQRP